MIGSLSGKLVAKQPPQVLLEVAGVGYEIDVPMSTFYNLPAPREPLKLHTHLVVREDAHQLYGFASRGASGVPQAVRFRVRRAHRAVGAFRAVGRRTRAIGGRCGHGAAHQGAGHRKEDGRTAAARAQGKNPGKESTAQRSGVERCSSMRLSAWAIAKRR